ncbi:MAG: family 78 glycoside hydrolase catalytic domain [Armatimonadetes bacterium]|nr:family 78 glycoside hydrolase catalytic domain [Armatimonadota bacterium]
MLVPLLGGKPALLSGPFAGADWLTIPVKSSPIEQASWIWVQRKGESAPTIQKASVGTVHLRREWTLDEEPKEGTAWFTADNRSKIKLNGKAIGQSNAWESITKVDLHGLLHKGVNIFEIEATNDKGTSDQNPGGFIFASQATLTTGRVVELVSDQNWKSPDGTVLAIGGYGTSPWNKTAVDVPPPVFHKTIELEKKPTGAVAKVVGLGQFDLKVNERIQGDTYINGPWSQYDKTLYWQEIPIQGLKKGSNAFDAYLGNSFYRVAETPDRYAKGDAMPDFSGDKPYLFALVLEVRYDDGTSDRFTTDESWKWRSSPYTYSHVYGGEDYDARLEALSGPLHDVVVANPPTAELLPVTFPLFKAKEMWKPVRVFETDPGVWTYVYPQNAMAIMRLKVHGPAGGKIQLTPSEVMTEAGKVEQMNLWGGHSYTTYTLKGGDSESHDWRFFYHGFQFVRMEGGVPAGQPNPKNLPVVESLEMVHIRTDNPQIGEFATSSDLFNKTHSLVDWAMRSNMGYVLTDCPHREKLGWLECDHLLFRSFAYRYDVRDWYKKITRDLRDIQLPDGRITTVAPDYLMLPVESPYKFTIEWGAAGVLVPWQAYEWYGDKKFLTENFGMMKRYVDWIASHAVDGIAPKGLGDWYDYGHGQSPGPSRFTPTDETATVMWAMCTRALLAAAKVLDSTDDVTKYSRMIEEIRISFLTHFYDPAAKEVKNNGSPQTANAMALCADLIPESDRKDVVEGIVRDLEKRDFQQTPGDVGHLFFIRALAEAGRSDVLHKVYSRTGLGSYGGILAKGLTTMPETWDAITVGSNSLNHCMLGHVMEWFYGWVLGIRQAPGSVGWNRILIAPEPGSLRNAKGKTKTPHGECSISWSQTDTVFEAKVLVPSGVQAAFTSPYKSGETTLDGRAVSSKLGPLGRQVINVDAGEHTISVRRHGEN